MALADDYAVVIVYDHAFTFVPRNRLKIPECDGIYDIIEKNGRCGKMKKLDMICYKAFSVFSLPLESFPASPVFFFLKRDTRTHPKSIFIPFRARNLSY